MDRRKEVQWEISSYVELDKLDKTEGRIKAFVDSVIKKCSDPLVLEKALISLLIDASQSMDAHQPEEVAMFLHKAVQEATKVITNHKSWIKDAPIPTLSSQPDSTGNASSTGIVGQEEVDAALVAWISATAMSCLAFDMMGDMDHRKKMLDALALALKPASGRIMNLCLRLLLTRGIIPSALIKYKKIFPMLRIKGEVAQAMITLDTPAITDTYVTKVAKQLKEHVKLIMSVPGVANEHELSLGSWTEEHTVQREDALDALVQVASCAWKIKDQELAMKCASHCVSAVSAATVPMRAKLLQLTMALDSSPQVYSQQALQFRIKCIAEASFILADAKSSGNISIEQEVALELWKMCVPLLQPKLRSTIKRPLQLAVASLERISSPFAEIRSTMHLELAKILEQEGLVDAALIEVIKSEKLNAGGDRFDDAIKKLRASLETKSAPESLLGSNEDIYKIVLQEIENGKSAPTKEVSYIALLKALRLLCPSDITLIHLCDHPGFVAEKRIYFTQNEKERVDSIIANIEGEIKMAEGVSVSDAVSLLVYTATTARSKSLWDVSLVASQLAIKLCNWEEKRQRPQSSKPQSAKKKKTKGKAKIWQEFGDNSLELQDISRMLCMRGECLLQLLQEHGVEPCINEFQEPEPPTPEPENAIVEDAKSKKKAPPKKNGKATAIEEPTEEEKLAKEEAERQAREAEEKERKQKELEEKWTLKKLSDLDVAFEDSNKIDDKQYAELDSSASTQLAHRYTLFALASFVQAGIAAEEAKALWLVKNCAVYAWNYITPLISATSSLAKEAIVAVSELLSTLSHAQKERVSDLERTPVSNFDKEMQEEKRNLHTHFIVRFKFMHFLARMLRNTAVKDNVSQETREWCMTQLQHVVDSASGLSAQLIREKGAKYAHDYLDMVLSLAIEASIHCEIPLSLQTKNVHIQAVQAIRTLSSTPLAEAPIGETEHESHARIGSQVTKIDHAMKLLEQCNAGQSTLSSFSKQLRIMLWCNLAFMYEECKEFKKTKRACAYVIAISQSLSKKDSASAEIKAFLCNVHILLARVEDKALLDALSHAGEAVSIATSVRAISLVGVALTEVWNVCIATMQDKLLEKEMAPLLLSILQKTTQLQPNVLADIDVAYPKLRKGLYELCIKAFADLGNWEPAVAVGDLALRQLNKTEQDGVFVHRMLCKVMRGEEVEREMYKLSRRPAEMQARAWLSLAQNEANPQHQVNAYLKSGELFGQAGGLVLEQCSCYVEGAVSMLNNNIFSTIADVDKLLNQAEELLLPLSDTQSFKVAKTNTSDAETSSPTENGNESSMLMKNESEVQIYMRASALVLRIALIRCNFPCESLEDFTTQLGNMHTEVLSFYESLQTVALCMTPLQVAEMKQALQSGVGGGKKSKKPTTASSMDAPQLVVPSTAKAWMSFSAQPYLTCETLFDRIRTEEFILCYEACKNVVDDAISHGCSAAILPLVRLIPILCARGMEVSISTEVSSCPLPSPKSMSLGTPVLSDKIEDVTLTENAGAEMNASKQQASSDAKRYSEEERERIVASHLGEHPICILASLQAWYISQRVCSPIPKDEKDSVTTYFANLPPQWVTCAYSEASESCGVAPIYVRPMSVRYAWLRCANYLVALFELQSLQCILPHLSSLFDPEGTVQDGEHVDHHAVAEVMAIQAMLEVLSGERTDIGVMIKLNQMDGDHAMTTRVLNSWSTTLFVLRSSIAPTFGHISIAQQPEPHHLPSTLAGVQRIFQSVALLLDGILPDDDEPPTQHTCLLMQACVRVCRESLLLHPSLISSRFVNTCIDLYEDLGEAWPLISRSIAIETMLLAWRSVATARLHKVCVDWMEDSIHVQQASLVLKIMSIVTHIEQIHDECGEVLLPLAEHVLGLDDEDGQGNEEEEEESFFENERIFSEMTADLYILDIKATLHNAYSNMLDYRNMLRDNIVASYLVSEEDDWPNEITNLQILLKTCSDSFMVNASALVSMHSELPPNLQQKTSRVVVHTQALLLRAHMLSSFPVSTEKLPTGTSENVDGFPSSGLGTSEALTSKSTVSSNGNDGESMDGDGVGDGVGDEDVADEFVEVESNSNGDQSAWLQFAAEAENMLPTVVSNIQTSFHEYPVMELVCGVGSERCKDSISLRAKCAILQQSYKAAIQLYEKLFEEMKNSVTPSFLLSSLSQYQAVSAFTAPLTWSTHASALFQKISNSAAGVSLLTVHDTVLSPLQSSLPQDLLVVQPCFYQKDVLQVSFVPYDDFGGSKFFNMPFSEGKEEVALANAMDKFASVSKKLQEHMTAEGVSTDVLVEKLGEAFTKITRSQHPDVSKDIDKNEISSTESNSGDAKENNADTFDAEPVVAIPGVFVDIIASFLEMEGWMESVCSDLMHLLSSIATKNANERSLVLCYPSYLHKKLPLSSFSSIQAYSSTSVDASVSLFSNRSLKFQESSTLNSQSFYIVSPKGSTDVKGSLANYLVPQAKALLSKGNFNVVATEPEQTCLSTLANAEVVVLPSDATFLPLLSRMLAYVSKIKLVVIGEQNDSMYEDLFQKWTLCGAGAIVHPLPRTIELPRTWLHERLGKLFESMREGSLGYSTNLVIPSNDSTGTIEKKDKGKDKKGKTPKPAEEPPSEEEKIFYPDFIQRAFTVCGCELFSLQ